MELIALSLPDGIGRPRNGQATDSLPWRRAAPGLRPSYHQNKLPGHLPASAVLRSLKTTRRVPDFLFLGSYLDLRIIIYKV